MGNKHDGEHYDGLYSLLKHNIVLPTFMFNTYKFRGYYWWSLLNISKIAILKHFYYLTQICKCVSIHTFKLRFLLEEQDQFCFARLSTFHTYPLNLMN